MTQMMDLNKMGLMPLNDVEIHEVDGGKTDFAYDAGTFIRAFWKYLPGTPKAMGESAVVIAQWYFQQ